MKGIISIVELFAVGIVLFLSYYYFFVYSPTTKILPIKEKILIFDFLISEFGYQTNLFDTIISNNFSFYISKDLAEVSKILKYKYKLYNTHFSEILVACNCSNSTISYLNNFFRNMEINGRNITISFVWTNLEKINPSDALLIWGCIGGDYYLNLIQYLMKGGGIINICDKPFENGNNKIYREIFSLKECPSTPLTSLTNITKPISGFDVSYEPKKYFFNIKVFGDYSKYKWNYAFDNVIGNNRICERNEDITKVFLFTPGTPKNLTACVINDFEVSKAIWVADFTKGFTLENLSEDRKNLLLSLLLTAAKKSGYPREEVRMYKTSVFFIDFNYKDYFEPFYFVLSIS